MYHVARVTHLGAKWMPTLDWERHFALDCISRMSGSSPGSPKPNMFMHFSDFGAMKKWATRFWADVSHFRGVSCVLDLCFEQNDDAIFMHIWIMIHHDASWPIMIHHDPSWFIMMHHDPSMSHGTSWYITIHHYHPSWCIMMRHDPSVSIMILHDASWSILIHHDATLSWWIEAVREAHRPKILVYIYILRAGKNDMGVYVEFYLRAPTTHKL